MELGNHIKHHRSRLGLSQEQLAAAIFVSRQTISNWETDRTYPDVQSLLLLSNLFDVSVDDLIKGDVEEMKTTISAEAQRMRRLRTTTIACGAAAVLWATVSCLVDMNLPVIVIPFVMLCAPCAISVVLYTKIQYDNRLFTYRALDAFLNGEQPDTASEENRKAGRMWPAKLTLASLVTAAIAFCCGWGLMSIVGRFLP